MAVLAAVAASTPVCADVGIGATLGIGGRFRDGGWIPVTVTLQKSGDDPIEGQVQAFADPNAGLSPQAASAQSDSPATVYAVPITLAGPALCAGTSTLYIRNIDPISDNLTLQVVQGLDRGDGPVLGSIKMLQAQRQMILGLPIKEPNIWIVGISADPGAFAFLSGQNFGILHTHSGPRDISTIPTAPATQYMPYGMTPTSWSAKTEVSSAAVADLPDKAVGYDGVDAVMLRGDTPLDALTEAQAQALRDWIAGGGHLVITGGSNASDANVAFSRDMLPAEVSPGLINATIASASGLGTISAETLVAKPLPGVRVLQKSSNGAPLVVAGSFGAGSVTMIAFDPTTLAFQDWTGPSEVKFWRSVVTAGQDRPSSILGYIAGREEGDSAFAPTGGHPTQLTDCLINVPSLQPPDTVTVAIFLVVYILLIVPVNYLVLKRMDRREWAWLTIPAVVAVFAVGTYAVGYAMKGSSFFVNRISIIETTAGSRASGIYSALGIFSPTRRTYNLLLNDPESLIGQPEPFNDRWGNLAQSSSDSAQYGAVHVLEGGSGCSVLDATVNMWAMRTFDSVSAGDLGGTIDASVSYDAVGGFQATVANNTPYRLTNCRFTYGQSVNDLGTMAPGAQAPVPTLSRMAERPMLSGSIVYQNAPDFGFPSITFDGDYGDTAAGSGKQTDISTGIRNSAESYLASFVEVDQYNPYGVTGSDTGEPPIRYAARNDEAIFSAWVEGPGPGQAPLTLDGRSVDENCVSLLVVHIPIRVAAPHGSMMRHGRAVGAPGVHPIPFAKAGRPVAMMMMEPGGGMHKGAGQ